MEEEEFDKALEKLEIHGGARIDFGGNVTAARQGWKKSYRCRRSFAPSSSSGCSVHHGERVPHGGAGAAFWRCGRCLRPCGKCDVCDPAGAVLDFRQATAAERAMAQGSLMNCGRWTIRLREHCSAASIRVQHKPRRVRRTSGCDVRAGLIEIEDAEYKKDGEVLRFRKVVATESGLKAGAAEGAQLLIVDGIAKELASVARARPTRRRTAPERSRRRRSSRHS